MHTCPNCGEEWDNIGSLSKHHTKMHPDEFEDLFWHFADDESEGECWEWRGRMAGCGYGQIQRDGERLYAHRLAYELESGESADPQINHHCDNPVCVNPDHLYCGTHQDNIQDALERSGREAMEEGLKVGWDNASEHAKKAWEDGKMIDPEDSSFSKLSRGEVEEIKYDVDRDRTQRSVAEEYGVDRRTVGKIWRGDTWVGV